MKKLVVKGSHKTIGNMIGEEFRNEMNVLTDIFKEQVIPSLYNNMTATEVFEEFSRKTEFYANIRENAPELFEEINGMAEAAGIGVEELVLLNCLDELVSFSFQNKPADKCTCLAIQRKNDNQVIVAQNLDLSPYFDEYQIILHTKYEFGDMQQLIFTSPGYLGYTGVNNRSVAVVPNALKMLRYNKSGMPVAVMIRKILEKQTAKNAARFVADTTHGAGQNYTIGDRDGIFSLECSGSKKVQNPIGENKYFYYTAHTNHQLVNDDISAAAQEHMSAAAFNSTIQRQKTASRYFESADHPFTEEDLKKILISHEYEPSCICRHGETGEMTIGSVIYSLGREIEMNFAAGPGCIRPYVKYTFDE